MTDRNSPFVSALVEALSASGVEHACISPGSRNTPLSLAFAAHPGITDWSHHDERSGSFFAIGLAVATNNPVAVVTTSGTATTELHLTDELGDSSLGDGTVIDLRAGIPGQRQRITRDSIGG